MGETSCGNCASFDHTKRNLEEQCAVALSLYTSFGVELGKGSCSEWWQQEVEKPMITEEMLVARWGPRETVHSEDDQE